MSSQFAIGRLLAWITAAVALIAVAISIHLHPPSEARARRLDQIRMQSLQQTEIALYSYFAAHQALPADLSVLDSEENHHRDVKWHDPETGQPYEYSVTGDKTYQLCATFSMSSDTNDTPIGLFGTHTAGRDCFQMKANSLRSQGIP